MANWYKNLYVGKTAKGREQNTYAANEKDQLDIIESKYLVQKQIQITLPEIIGVALGYQEAIEIIQKITIEAFENTGNCDLRYFLQSNIL